MRQVWLASWMLAGAVLMGTLSGCGSPEQSTLDQPEAQQDLVVYVTEGATRVRAKAQSYDLPIRVIEKNSPASELGQALIQAKFRSPSQDFFVVLNPQFRLVDWSPVSAGYTDADLDARFRHLKLMSNAGKRQLERLQPSVPGKARLVVFSDYQCPYCKTLKNTQLADWQETFGDRLEVELVHFPLANHKDAFLAAEAAECARAQGKFDEYSQRLFDNQSNLVEWKLYDLAASLKLDRRAFRQCLQLHQSRKKVRHDQYLGQYLGVSGTPTLLLNGQLMDNMPPQQVEEYINRILE